MVKVSLSALLAIHVKLYKWQEIEEFSLLSYFPDPTIPNEDNAIFFMQSS